LIRFGESVFRKIILLPVNNSKLISLLKTLSLSEMKEFKDYVQSPFFNKNKKVVALFDFIKKFHPGYDNDGLTDESISAALFPGMKHDYFKIRNLTSDLFALAKDFLSQIYFRDESIYYPTFLLEKLREKNLNIIVEQTLKQFKNQLSKETTKDEFYQLRLAEMSQQEHFYQITKDPFGSHSYFQEDFDNFFEYALLKLLKFYCIMIHDNVQNNFSFDMKMFDQVLDFIRTTEKMKNPTLIVFSRIVLLVLEKKEEHFFRLKSLREEYSASLQREDRYMLDLYMSGFCADVYNIQAGTDFQREHFLISKKQFERDEMTVGKMLYPDFLIHVKIATRVDEFDWAEMFINKYKDQIAEDEKQSCLNFCYGYMSCKKGQYEKAMDLLSRANFRSNLLKTQVKVLLLQCYYELGHDDQVLSMIDTFKKFLNRDTTVTEYYKNAFVQYLKISSDLLRVRELPKGKKRNYEITGLQMETENVINNLFGIKLWLREKLSEL